MHYLITLPTITDDSALGESVIQRSLRFKWIESI